MIYDITRAGSQPGLMRLLAAVILMTMILGGCAHGQETSGAGAVGLSALAPPAGLAAARADGRADDTAAVQAQVVYARDHGAAPLRLPPGMYRLTSPLVLGNAPASAAPLPPLSDIESGWVLDGQGAPATFSAPGLGGTVLYQGGRGQPAVLEFGSGGWRNSQINNLRIAGYAPNVTPPSMTDYGLWNAGWTHWSSLTLTHVIFGDVRVGIRITAPADGGYSQGANGEDLNCYDCQFDVRQTVYENSSPSGQSFPESWYGTKATTSVPGGTAYVFGGIGPNRQQGNNFCSFGSSLTMAHEPALSAASATNTFLQDYGAEMINFVGGRDEGVGTVVSWQMEGTTDAGIVAISGHKFDGMNGFKPLLKSVGGHEQIRVLLTGDSFYSYAAAPLTLAIDRNSKATVVLTDCDFDGWTDYTALTESPRLTLVRCRARTNTLVPYTPLTSLAEAPAAQPNKPAPKGASHGRTPQHARPPAQISH